MKAVFIFFYFLLFQVNLVGQINTTIDLVGSYDFINNARFEIGFDERNRGDRGSYRFGINANFRIADRIYVKTGLRYVKQGYKIEDFYITPPSSFPYNNFIDEYYIEVPLLFRFELSQKKVSLFYELGVSPHILLNKKNVFEYESYSESFDYESQYLEGKRIRMAFVIGIGVNYNLSNVVQFFGQPTFRYYPAIKIGNTRPGIGDSLDARNIGIEIGFRRILSYEKSKP